LPPAAAAAAGVMVEDESLHMSLRHPSAVTAFFTQPQIIRILMDAG